MNIAKVLGILYAHSIGTEKDVGMSWANELVPPPLTPRAIWAEATSAWKAYSEAKLPIPERLLFLCLRLVQRCSYNLGWEAGVQEGKTKRA